MASRTGREKEAAKILQANLSATVGRLLLGEFTNWDDFAEPLKPVLLSLPRKNLKSGARDVDKRLSKEIKQFFNRNFKNTSPKMIRALYVDIHENEGLEIPLNNFEEKYFKIKNVALTGIPRHATVVISLWGLQFQFPEDELTKDITQSLKLAEDVSDQLKDFKKIDQKVLKEKRTQISDLYRTKNFSCRSCILSCFNLIEAYLNGIAWEYVSQNTSLDGLSKNEQNLIRDSSQVSLRKKIIKYPEIISGKPLWDDDEPDVKKFLETMKPFRDSLVHPSPFSVTEKFGGYDKLKIIYRLDLKEAKETAKMVFKLISKIHFHIKGENAEIPKWLEPFANVN